MKVKILSAKDFAKLAGVTVAAISKSRVLEPARVGRRIDANHSVAREYVSRRRAATGDALDPLYDQALEYCIEVGRFSQTAIVRRFKVGRDRGARIIGEMRESGVIPPAPVKRTAAPVKETAKAKRAHARKVKARKVKEAETPHVRGTASRKAKQKEESFDPEDVFDVPENILEFAEYTIREIVDKFGTDQRFLDFLMAVQKIEMINEKRLKAAISEGDLVNRNMVQTGVIDIFNAAHLRLMQDGAKSITAGVVSKFAGGSEPAEIELYVADLLGSFIRPIKHKVMRSLNGL